MRMWFHDTSLIPRFQAILGLSLFGLIVAGYSLAHHYGDDAGWCNLGDTLNCDVVNRGPYAEVGGIPVALIGVIGYCGLACISILALKKKDEQQELLGLIKWAVTVALLFSLYLTYLEAFVLGVYCPLCLISLAVVISMAVVLHAPSRTIKV